MVNLKLKIRTSPRGLFFRFYVNDLTAFVRAGLEIDSVRHFGLARILIGIELRRFQRVMGATLARARFGMSAFWNWHYYL